MSLHGTCGEYQGRRMYLTSSGAGVLGTFLPNLSAALSWGIVAGSVSEPGRNQVESAESCLESCSKWDAKPAFCLRRSAFRRRTRRTGLQPGFGPGFALCFGPANLASAGSKPRAKPVLARSFPPGWGGLFGVSKPPCELRVSKTQLLSLVLTAVAWYSPTVMPMD